MECRRSRSDSVCMPSARDYYALSQLWGMTKCKVARKHMHTHAHTRTHMDNMCRCIFTYLLCGESSVGYDKGQGGTKTHAYTRAHTNTRTICAHIFSRTYYVVRSYMGYDKGPLSHKSTVHTYMRTRAHTRTHARVHTHTKTQCICTYIFTYLLCGESSMGYDKGPGGTTIWRTAPGFMVLRASSRPGTTVCMYVCIYLCHRLVHCSLLHMYVCMYVCMYVFVPLTDTLQPASYVCMYVCMYVCICAKDWHVAACFMILIAASRLVCTYVYVCVYVCMGICMYVCMYVCMGMCGSGAAADDAYPCMHVCMCICMHMMP